MSESPKRVIHTPWFDYEVDAQAYKTMVADFSALAQSNPAPEEALSRLTKGVLEDMEALKHLGERYFAPFCASLPGGKRGTGIACSLYYPKRYWPKRYILGK